MSENISIKSLAKMIDHSLLHPTLTDNDIIKGCELSRHYDVATVCVKPYSISMAAGILNGSDVGVCAVVSFPHGNSTLAIKLKEIEKALHDGATEIDSVVNIGKVLGRDWGYVSEEIQEMNNLTVNGNGILKVIFENDFLEEYHIIRLCEICSDEQVAFAKTSTGYGFVKHQNGMYSYNGATDNQLKLMRQHCSRNVQIKAAGGIRTLDDLLRVRLIEVTRIGATATSAILEEAISRSNN